MLKKYVNTYRSLIFAVLALIILVIIASLSYWFVSGREYSFFDALYMTIITLTTIGYGEIIDLSNNPPGRLLTIFIALIGIGILTYILTNVTAIIVEGKLTDYLRRRRMENKIQKLRGHYIICGVGKVGVHIMNELCATKRQVVLIDTNLAALENTANDRQDILFVEGDATDNINLTKANVQKAAGIFAVTSDDNQNLVICFSAKQLNHDIRVVTRCSNIKNQHMLKSAGADAIISPTYIGGLRMASEMVRPTVVSFLDIMLRDSGEQLRVEEVRVSDKYAGKEITGLELNRYPGTLLLAVRSQEKWLYHPPANYLIKSGDSLILMTNPLERQMLQEVMQ